MVSKFNIVFTSSDITPNIFNHKKIMMKHKDIKLINDYNKILCMYELQELIIQNSYQYDGFCASNAIRELKVQLEYETYEFLINNYQDELQADTRGEITDDIIKKYLNKFHKDEIRCNNCHRYTKDRNERIVCCKYRYYCNECWNNYIDDVKGYDKHYCKMCNKYKMDIVEWDKDKNITMCRDCWNK